jgi:hypothetical protein
MDAMEPTEEIVPLKYGEAILCLGANKPGAETSDSVEIVSTELIEELRRMLGVEAVWLCA